MDRITRMEYLDYMHSKAWDRRRTAFFTAHKRRCKACKATTNIQLHHLTYASLKSEPDRDLIPLCKDCHELVHKAHKAANRGRKNANLRAITFKFIASTQKAQRMAKINTPIEKTWISAPVVSRGYKKPRRR